MESNFFSDRTFIRALVATLQLPDEHLQFFRSAPPVIFTPVFVTFFICICWFLHLHLMPSQLQQSVWNCVGILLMKAAIKLIFSIFVSICNSISCLWWICLPHIYGHQFKLFHLQLDLWDNDDDDEEGEDEKSKSVLLAAGPLRPEQAEGKDKVSCLSLTHPLKGLSTYYVSQFLRFSDPPSPLFSNRQHLLDPPSPLVSLAFKENTLFYMK